MPNILPKNNKALEHWIQQLDNTRLPVYKAQRELALAALHSGDQSLGEIAQVISQAPTIAFIIMRESNRNSSTRAQAVQTLEQALSRLGLTRCGVLLNSLVDDQESDIPFALRQVWMIGQHLNVQAKGLFSTRMARLAQEIHWGSLLFLSPSWPLLTRHPEFFSEWERRVLGNNEPALSVEQELLGMPLTQLCLGLAEHWQLPDWIIEGYRLLNDNAHILVQALSIARHTEQPLLQQQKLDDQPTLNNWFHRPANTLVLACGLVMAAHNSWGNEQCIRWQRLISLYLNQELAVVQQTTHQLAVEHARLQRTDDLWQPAQTLLWPWSVRRLRQTAATAQPVPPNSDDLAQWRDHCSQLLQSPSPFSNPVQLTHCISLALQACGMRRICIMLLNAQELQLQVTHTHGFSPEQIPARFNMIEHPTTASLLTEPSCLVITDTNRAQLTPHLPAELHTFFKRTHWVLASLSNGSRQVMLIAADQAAVALHPITLQAFKKTLEHIGRALVLFNSRKR